MHRDEITILLEESTRGDSQAESRLFDLVQEELRQRAHLLMARERADHTLETTDLVHEAWLRMFSGRPLGEHAHGHFLQVAARAMRHVLVDHARRKATQKRGNSATKTPIDLAIEGLSRTGCNVLALHESLNDLRGVDPQLANLVELRFFGGATLKECAAAQKVSVPTAERRWRIARIWLQAQWEA